MDFLSLRSAAAQAVPLDGRTAVEPPAEADWSRADRRLARWRGQEPFARDDWFDRRLAQANLDQAALRAQLAGARPAAGEAWIDRLISSFGHSPAPIPAEHAFATPVARLVAMACEQVPRAELFVSALTGELHAMAARTMVLELNVARVTGQLTADTSQGRFAEFVDSLADPPVAVRLLTEYPVLARQLTLATDAWIRNSRLLLERLSADLPRLRAAFGDLGKLSTVDIGLGDRHRGGQTVARLGFDSGKRLMYKPRPVDVDVHFQRLLEWLNGHLDLRLRTLAVVPRDGYGWVEHVTAYPCTDDAEIHRFYWRSGALLAALHLLEATDMHGQNMIAAGDQPVIVDLETLLQPEFLDPPKRLSEAERLAYADNAHSVLRIGILPYRVWVEEGHDGADLSALGWTPGVRAPRDSAELVDAQTDRMRIDYLATKLEDTLARPVADGEPIDLLDQISALDNGFTTTYGVFAAHREEVRALLRVFADDEVRVLRRDTLEYASLLRTGFHPDLLRDALDRDRHFDRLWSAAAADTAMLPFVPYERQDLWDNDIPVFTMRPDGVHVRASGGDAFDMVCEGPPMTAVLGKLDRLGDADLDRQRRYLRSAVAAGRPGGAEEANSPHYLYQPGDPAKLVERALEHARGAADELMHWAYRGAADLAWTGPNLTPSGGWVVAPLGPDFYSGTSGIALFLDSFARVTGDGADAASAALVTLDLQIRRRLDRMISGFSSAGGVLYALARLAGRWPVADELAGLVLERIAELIDDDETYDLMGGCAGNIGGLAAWHAVRPDDRVVALVRACADHLAATAVAQQTGVGWIPAPLRERVSRPLAGFGHGAAGIAWSLDKAAGLLGDPRCRELAADALAYERTLFLPESGNWLDVRDEGDRRPLVAWCHGAAGIGLSKVDMAMDGPELEAAAASVRGSFGRNFSLCHGDLGNLDLLLSMPGADWRPAAAGVLDGLDREGFLTGMPRGVATPSLMTGLAGIGYGLLRIAAPDVVPSVLRMEI
ncbi:type 2 lanthipeptide synthetase LanM family protein [Fodinicola acaciae]|uniref:type 2 lanthipeptide synthetase LanM family protein n=1 Tax=Fodinicola acaciae TaxID=2681555 RepID=UPI0013CFA109|nr:type 2 lanthipeptide synthetase LanM family protein [Fodinicola acaciae]